LKPSAGKIHADEKCGIPKFSIGDIVRDIAEKEGEKLTRRNLQKIGEKYRNRCGKEYFIQEAVRKIEKHGWKSVAITGVRTPADVAVLRREYGENLVLVHVRVADPRIRFERIRKRGEPRDPQGYDAFREQDRKEEQLFHLSATIEQADITISNEGTLEDFHEKIERNLIF
jgi:dephospho-CoA kinase